MTWTGGSKLAWSYHSVPSILAASILTHLNKLDAIGPWSYRNLRILVGCSCCTLLKDLANNIINRRTDIV